MSRSDTLPFFVEQVYGHSWLRPPALPTFYVYQTFSDRHGRNVNYLPQARMCEHLAPAWIFLGGGWVGEVEPGLE